MFNHTELSFKTNSQKSLTSLRRIKISQFCLCDTLWLLTVNTEAWQLLFQFGNSKHPSTLHGAAVQRYTKMLCWGKQLPHNPKLGGSILYKTLSCLAASRKNLEFSEHRSQLLSGTSDALHHFMENMAWDTVSADDITHSTISKTWEGMFIMIQLLSLIHI